MKEDRSETFDIVDAVFPYPYRGMGYVFSKSYRERVKRQYREASRGFVIVDAGISGLLFIGELVLIVGLPALLIFGD